MIFSRGKKKVYHHLHFQNKESPIISLISLFSVQFLQAIYHSSLNYSSTQKMDNVLVSNSSLCLQNARFVLLETQSLTPHRALKCKERTDVFLM